MTFDLFDLFDYKTFSERMTEQANELVPIEFTENEKEYIVKAVKNFSYTTGEAICKDTESQYKAETAIFSTQVITEWIFHKSVDLIRAKIPQEYWDAILQKIAFVIFEVAKEAIIREIPQEQILRTVEYQAVKAYIEEIDKLFKENRISESVAQNAYNQSNIDKMATESHKEYSKRDYIKQQIKNIILGFGCLAIITNIIILINKHQEYIQDWIGRFLFNQTLF